MPFSVGIDLVDVTGVREALDAHGDAYLRRVYTPAEVADAAGDPQRLAARFAAKEATLKALRAGDRAIPLTSIEVRRLDDGAPELRLRGAAAALATATGVVALSVSLTHEGESAAAVVFAEISPQTDQDRRTDHR
jgi:holo-[acyl-carrier protein] synthase